jgi:hypothetical protein
MISWRIPLNTVEAWAWVLEAFVYFDYRIHELAIQLRGIETELKGKERQGTERNDTRC